MMQYRDYLLPAIAALLLAVVFPIYWFNELVLASDSDSLLRNITTVSSSDAVFLMIGLLSIYVYLSLKNILHDQLNFKRIDLLILLVIGVHVLFLSTLALDVTSAFLSDQALKHYQDLFVTIGISSFVAITVLFGILDILIGAVLLKNSNELPTTLMVFAIITLIQGVLGVTVFLSMGTLASFPLSLIILATYFLQKPESLEVV